MVSTVPLPATRAEKEQVLANESKGVTESLPKPEEKVEPEAIDIPDKDIKVKKPKPEPSATKRKPEPAPVEQANNVVPFGQGGPVSGPYGTFSALAQRAASALPAVAAISAADYSWYVRVVQQKVSENWQKYEVDPNIGTGSARLLDIRRHARRTPRQCTHRNVKRCALARSVGYASHSAY